MSKLTDAAAAALAAESTAAETARETARREARRGATDALKAVLGTMTLTDAGLTADTALTEPLAGQVVWGDGEGRHLAALNRQGEWRVFLVRVEANKTLTRLSRRLTSLADLGRALAAPAPSPEA